MHEGVKYQCEKCDFESSWQKCLSVHKKSVHEGVKYHCNLCDYKTGQQGTLQTYKKNVHEGVKVKCDQCHVTLQGHLSHHKKLFHDGQS